MFEPDGTVFPHPEPDMQAVPADFLETAIQAVECARKITRDWFRIDLNVESKQDKSPVTLADQQTEQAVKQLILERHPDHSFLGEETGEQINDREWQWIIDPIDGTKSFATGNPTFGTLIALLHHRQPVVGIIDHAMLNERWVGIHGQPSLRNEVPCQTRQIAQLEQASIYTTTLDMFDETTYPRYDRLSKKCQFRVFGGDCYAYGLLSSGWTDIVCEADLKPYDYLALVPVVEGAGGIITDWQGHPLTLESSDQVIAAANSSLHQTALDILNA